MSITRINHFQAAAGKADELFTFLKSLEPYITSSQGCTYCEVLKSDDKSDQFVVIEKWASIEAHKNSIDNFPKDQMQAAMTLFAKPPESGFYHN